MAVRSGSDTIRLTVVLEGISALLRELKASLDGRGLSDRYDRQALFRFLKTATYSDQSWERVYAIFWRYLLATLAAAVLGAVLGRVASAYPGVILAWAIASSLWPTGVYAAAEIAFARRLAKLSDEAVFACPPRDRAWERSIYRRAIAWGVGAYVAAAGLAFALGWYWRSN